MGRRVSVGIATPGGNTGLISVDYNTIASVEANSNLTLDPNGTGNVIISSNVSIESQFELRLHDADNTNFVALHAPLTVTDDYTLTLPSAQNPKANNALLADTSGNFSWKPVQYTYSVKTTSFSAVNYEGYFIDTSSGGVTVTLPATPAVGDTIRFLDVAKTFNTNNFTVNRNGKLIQGDAENLTVATESAAFELIFSGDTYGWRIFSV